MLDLHNTTEVALREAERQAYSTGDAEKATLYGWIADNYDLQDRLDDAASELKSQEAYANELVDERDEARGRLEEQLQRVADLEERIKELEDRD